MIGSIILRIIIGVIYFIPSIIGRNHTRFGQIFALNLFLGWTFVGWVIALVIAVGPDKKEEQVFPQ